MTDSEQRLRAALGELLDEISNLDGIEFNRSLDPHEAEANWDAALSQARTVWKETAPT